VLYRSKDRKIFRKKKVMEADDYRVEKLKDYRRLGEQYCYGVAALCELYHRTRDRKLGALLEAAAEKEFAKAFYRAPLYLSDLYACVGHTTGKTELGEKDAVVRKPSVTASASQRTEEKG